MKSKALAGLQLFAHRKLRKQMKEDFALKHYSKVLLKEAMTAMLVYHQRKLAKKNMTLVLQKKCGTSWLEWHLPDTPVQ